MEPSPNTASQVLSSPATTPPVGAKLPRQSWVKLNRLRSGVGCFGRFMKQRGPQKSTACAYGKPVQTADHIIDVYPTFQSPCGDKGLSNLDDRTVAWLNGLPLDMSFVVFIRKKTSFSGHVRLNMQKMI